MRHLAGALFCFAAALGPSCVERPPPAGQLLLYVDTDAPLPQVAGTSPDPTRLSPLVDRARFEVLVDGKPLAGSSRDFAIDEEMLRGQKLSFGIAPSPNDGAVSVRVRLFRADRIFSADLPAGVTLDTIVALPPVAAEGITEVGVTLRVDDFGRTVGPVPATGGRPPRPSLVGTWHEGHRVACAAPPSELDACVPGGSFFFGDPAFRGRTPANDIVDERLVWLSPFYLDRTEVTVAAFRALWPKLSAAGAAPPEAFYPPRDSGETKDFCTWTEEPTMLEGAPLDKLPVNCVSWATAHAYCIERGADLPSEAQFEYVASGLGEEWAFPWGNDEAGCTEAVWGRGGSGVVSEGSTTCRTPGTLGWVAFPGSGTRDRLNPTREGGDPEITDLGGNVTEWAVDMWNVPTEQFWNTVTPMVDPVAREVAGGGDADAHPGRGGSWSLTVLTTRAAFRGRRIATDRVPSIGFRCARRAEGR